MRNNKPRLGGITSTTPDGRRHVMRWHEWGEHDNPAVLVCAHGLTRNARDFDYLARVLMPRYRVICPDFPGRGQSDALADPCFYTIDQYADDMRMLLASLRFERLDWVGTSMGGLIGMTLAGATDNPISRLVINDVGAFIPKDALALIQHYLAVHPRFNDPSEAKDYFRDVYAGFGALEDEHYAHLVEHGIVAAGDGAGFVMNYDPAIVDQFVAVAPTDVDLWDLWQKISIAVLVIRGEKSGLLLEETVERMSANRATTQSIEIAGCAHAPSLMVEDQIRLIDNWLQN